MGRISYANRLGPADRTQLETLVRTGTRPARDVRRAQILLLSDAGKPRAEICTLLGASVTTVDRARHRWVTEGFALAVVDRPRSGRPRVLTSHDEAEVVARARSAPPTGVLRWAHRQLTAVLLDERRLSRPVSRETVLRCLRRHHVKPWKKGRRGASRR